MCRDKCKAGTLPAPLESFSRKNSSPSFSSSAHQRGPSVQALVAEAVGEEEVGEVVEECQVISSAYLLCQHTSMEDEEEKGETLSR